MARTFRNKNKNDFKKIKGFSKKGEKTNRKAVKNQIKKVIHQGYIEEFNEWEE